MVKTIKQRIYLMSVLPLAVLAVGLVLFNGLYRIDEANRELRNAEEVMAELLSGAAAEALVLGNALTFEQAAAAAMKTSPVLTCITLRDAEARVVSAAGRCSGGDPRIRYFTIKAPIDGLSDFAARGRNEVSAGQLGILLSDANVAAKRSLVSIQLAVSLVLIAVVVFLVGRLLRVRLIDPIRRIDAAMQALSRRDYDVDVHVPGADELARLAQEVNRTMRTIAAYTRDLERHRNDAERALHDADESNMSREALVRSLTEELEEPLGRMHSELTAVAIANHDPALRQRIKRVLELLQDAEANFADLIEVSSNAQPVKRSSMRDFSELISDLERDIDRLSETERVLVNLSVIPMPPIEDRSHLYSGIVDLDEARLRKALIYLIRAMARRCEEAGVHVNVEVIRRSVDELHISVHLKGFYTRLPEATGLKWLDELSHYATTPPRALGWTERETKIIAYLLRAIGLVPTFGTAPDGTVNIFLDTTCRFTIEPSDLQAAPDWLSARSDVATTLVSDDATLGRLVIRGDLSNHELVIVSFSRALAELEALRAHDVLLVDVTDIAAALALLDQLREEGGSLPNLVAICPPGHISDSLGTRLFELGFRGIIQKPLHYVRLLQVVRSVLANSLHRRGDHRSVGRR